MWWSSAAFLENPSGEKFKWRKCLSCCVSNTKHTAVNCCNTYFLTLQAGIMLMASRVYAKRLSDCISKISNILAEGIAARLLNVTSAGFWRSDSNMMCLSLCNVNTNLIYLCFVSIFITVVCNNFIKNEHFWSQH